MPDATATDARPLTERASDAELANAIRALAMDAVEAAKSGHPGMPMGMVEIGVALWTRHLRHNPRLGSKTPGHPELHVTPGVETTTGPLGQGLANGVGMALAEKLLAAHFNRPGHTIVDHHTYVTVGDGCLMEGISHEACSLAGTLGLGKLIVLYDDNGVSIDGRTRGWFTDDTPARFEAYGWHVIPAVDGHDVNAVDQAIGAARAQGERPSLICCRTIIGKGAPNKGGTADAHGAALGDGEVAAARVALGWRHRAFAIPREVYAGFDARARGALVQSDWSARFAAYHAAHPDLAAELERRIDGRLPESFERTLDALVRTQADKAQSIATRKASQQAIEAFAQVLPEMIGGSADLTGSVFTNWSGSVAVLADRPGNYVNYGVREFAMAAIANGLALHGDFIPYVGTFLTFSDYMRNTVRMAALMKLRTIFVFTHDSIGLGEDEPTHQRAAVPVGRPRPRRGGLRVARPARARRRVRKRAFLHVYFDFALTGQGELQR